MLYDLVVHLGCDKETLNLVAKDVNEGSDFRFL